MVERYISYAFPLKPSMRGALDGGLPAAIVGQVVSNRNKGIPYTLNAITSDPGSNYLSAYNLHILGGGEGILNPGLLRLVWGTMGHASSRRTYVKRWISKRSITSHVSGTIR